MKLREGDVFHGTVGVLGLIGVDIRGLPHLGSMKESIVEDFEEPVES